MTSRVSARQRGGKIQGRWTRRRLLKGISLAAAAPAGAAAALAAEETSEKGTVWWTELITKDAAASRSFYAQVIGWTPKIVALEDSSRPARENEPSYTLFTQNEKEVAGALTPDRAAPLAGRQLWLTYFQVEDVDAAVGAALRAGGRIVQSPYDVPGSRLAVIEDTLGTPVGLAAPKPNPNK